MSIVDYITLNEQKYNSEEAIVHIKLNGMKSMLTWGELSKYSTLVARILIANGINQGDKVGIILENSLFWLPIYFGILKMGAVVVPINYRNSVDEIIYCAKLAECKGIIFSDANELCEGYRTVLEECFLLRVNDNREFWEKLLVIYDTGDVETMLDDKDIAAIYFSSGTTGKSKAIVLSHGALQSAAEIEMEHHRQTHSDRFLCVTPLYHTGSKIHWFGSLLVGGALVIFEPSTPLSIFNVIRKEKISIAWLLVPQIQDILDAIDFGDIKDIDISSLRLMHSGAQHVPASIILQWHNKFPNVMYDTNYGLTEASGPGCIHLGGDIEKAGSIGRPDSRWLVDIVDELGISKTKGCIGELILKGPGVMNEYYRDAEATCNTIKNGWLYTGDMAYLDDDGYIYIVDRKKDMIICGGENIYPIQIENHIRELSLVKDVAVIGLPNRRLGEVVVAVIELKEEGSCSKNEIHKHCKKLPEYQRPLRVYFGKVNRNATGKIDKKNIRIELSENNKRYK